LIGETTRALVRALISVDPYHRLSREEVIRSEWFAGADRRLRAVRSQLALPQPHAQERGTGAEARRMVPPPANKVSARRGAGRDRKGARGPAGARPARRPTESRSRQRRALGISPFAGGRSRTLGAGRVWTLGASSRKTPPSLRAVSTPPAGGGRGAEEARVSPASRPSGYPNERKPGASTASTGRRQRLAMRRSTWLKRRGAAVIRMGGWGDPDSSEAFPGGPKFPPAAWMAARAIRSYTGARGTEFVNGTEDRRLSTIGHRRTGLSS